MSDSGDSPETIGLVVCYDGTEFAGWQVQPALHTVQGEIESALARFYGVERLKIHGAGRTDAGVHALDQVASFEAPVDRPLEAIVRSANHVLPPTIRVLSAARMGDSFHARRSATQKTYRYRLVNRPILLPFEARWATHIYRELDLDAMAAAARRFIGRLDFASFAAAGNPTATTVRTVHRFDVLEKPGEVIEFVVSGDGFLYKMVRNMVGLLIEVGLGRREHSDVETVLEAKDRSAAGKTAAASGLALARVTYGADDQRRLRGGARGTVPDSPFLR